ncbi:hypothetical protein HNY73_007514 [Argiope bruennichi]|uniref:Uncharacterized protein n=1 Tax=Argiope bruennichi TaxID=94029 RepID=A0A8T0FE69_ARGBR|nr:hypothetical protein HNY73_007514 [Argiope bruennichi]
MTIENTNTICVLSFCRPRMAIPFLSQQSLTELTNLCIKKKKVNIHPTTYSCMPLLLSPCRTYSIDAQTPMTIEHTNTICVLSSCRPRMAIPSLSHQSLTELTNLCIKKKKVNIHPTTYSCMPLPLSPYRTYSVDAQTPMTIEHTNTICVLSSCRPRMAIPSLSQQSLTEPTTLCIKKKKVNIHPTTYSCMPLPLSPCRTYSVDAQTPTTIEHTNTICVLSSCRPRMAIPSLSHQSLTEPTNLCI